VRGQLLTRLAAEDTASLAALNRRLWALCVLEAYVAAPKETQTKRHMVGGHGHITFRHRMVIALSKTR